MLILAIESSCDETAAAVVEDGHLVRSDVVCSQIKLHARWGGVVPEIASRNHLLEVIPVIESALTQAEVTWDDIDAIAVTQGPGLVGALLVGLQVAKSLAFVHRKPLVPVHHLCGHLSAVALHGPDEPRPESPKLPHLALIVSGGHTAIYRVDAYDEVSLISNTQDDAAGEAFDKVSRMLGLGYPGGPVIEREARTGQSDIYSFTRPTIKAAPLDFSFSGLKTAVLTTIKRHGSLPTGQAQRDLLASFQRAAVDQLVHRVLAVMKHEKIYDVTLSGGVACNTLLRDELREQLTRRQARLIVPPRRWCTDNAAMIGAAAAHDAAAYIERGPAPSDLTLNARSSWAITEARTPSAAAPQRA